eukprot:m.139082 g.139082  ORF g.139082 m.139082 type:complete len:53 (+) comp18803_c0_seq1:921-1079(+)
MHINRRILIHLANLHFSLNNPPPSKVFATSYYSPSSVDNFPTGLLYWFYSIT